MKTRIQKILAQAGYGSRRSCELLITENRVKINGKTASLGMKADQAQDKITVDGHPITPAERSRYILLHKPRGVLSTVVSPDPRPTVRSLVDTPERLYPVGRLDVESEGLILMTNDGELTNQLTHPRYEHEKEYRILVSGQPAAGQLDTWRKGMVLGDGIITLPADVWVEGQESNGTWLGVILKEGKKRQIRKMGEVSSLPVKRLIRIRIASLNLGDLKSGEWRDLTAEEINQLKGTIN
ncbi:MAG: rRNA pseudouridine synthase [Anaerolineales bacterium]|nr:rRNA pseudouridine synthase [Anaerolineales bacterium]